MFLQEREEAYQRELEIARVEKEKEIARLRAQQERAKDKQAEKVSTFSVSFFFCFHLLGVREVIRSLGILRPWPMNVVPI